MQVQLSITNPTAAVLAAVFGADAPATGTTEETGEAKPRRGRKSNAEKAAEAAAAAKDTDDGLGEDGGGDDDLGIDDEPAAEAKKLDLEGDVIPAFKAFVKKSGSREPAVKILDKFGVKSVRELKEADYPKVMKLLK